MSKSDDFHTYAAQCLSLSAASDDANARTAWLEMAQKWQRLAAQSNERPTEQESQTTLNEPPPPDRPEP